MKIEEIKEIAENVFPGQNCAIIDIKDSALCPYVNVQGHGSFKPDKNDADCFKVLEALVEKGGNGFSVIEIGLFGENEEGFCVLSTRYKGKQAITMDLKESICKAYLNTIREKK